MWECRYCYAVFPVELIKSPIDDFLDYGWHKESLKNEQIQIPVNEHMGFLYKLKQLVLGRQDPVALLMEELNDEQKQWYREYEKRRGRHEFPGATDILQTLLTKDDNERHREFYGALIEEMRIYISQPREEPRRPPIVSPPPSPPKEGRGCIFGFHKWGKPTGISQPSSNVTDWKKKCLRCGTVVKWVEPWKPPKGKKKGRWDH